jgi:predicted HTH transcriptional regulator
MPFERIFTRQEKELVTQMDYNNSFETACAMGGLTPQEALDLLDYSVLFQPGEKTGPEIAYERLVELGAVVEEDGGACAVTNVGAILLAKKIASFRWLAQKTLRIVQYRDISNSSAVKEHTIEKGYAAGFNDVLHIVDACLPSNEVIKRGVKETVTWYPESTIKETIANALVHQDFSIPGIGVIIEIFSNRIEVTNAGGFMVKPVRVVDDQPNARNRAIVDAMRRLGICRGTGEGWDEIAKNCEEYKVPAPRINADGDEVRITLFQKKDFLVLSQDERINTAYMHCVYKNMNGEVMTVDSLRDRFNLEKAATARITKLIKATVAENLIKCLDKNVEPLKAKYIPFWA